MNAEKKSMKVLVVDDDLIQIKLAETILSEEGYEVLSAKEADEGLQLAMTSHPDIILLDVMMPVINGYNFCKLLKAEEKQKNIAIIMVTSRDELEDIEIGLEMGANAYLTKPIDRQELLKTIKVVQTGQVVSPEK